jgi:hypothetical protein
MRSLPEGLRPIRYSSDESNSKGEGAIGDEEKFRKFMDRNKYGFFLFSPALKINVNLRPKNGFCNVHIETVHDSLSEHDIVILMKALANSEAVFAMACATEEYHYRNLYRREVGSSSFEAWVGRDLSRYLPGLYWLTVLSRRHASLVPRIRAALAVEVVPIGSGHWLVKLFGKPETWPEHAPRIDDWLCSNPDVFCKRRAEQQLDAAPNIAALSLVAQEWR